MVKKIFLAAAVFGAPALFAAEEAAPMADAAVEAAAAAPVAEEAAPVAEEAAQ
jgi:hypothetical protein